MSTQTKVPPITVVAHDRNAAVAESIRIADERGIATSRLGEPEKTSTYNPSRSSGNRKAWLWRVPVSDEETKSLFIQQVSIDLNVAIEADVANLDTIMLDDLRERIEQHVRGVLAGWPALNKAVENVTARRGPTGSAYYGPEHRAKFQNGVPDVMNVNPPLPVTLTELGIKES